MRALDDAELHVLRDLGRHWGISGRGRPDATARAVRRLSRFGRMA